MKTTFDITDKTRYDYLEPIWKILEDTPEKGITTRELFEKTGLDEKKTNNLIKEIRDVFQNALMNVLKNPLKLLTISNDSFYEKNLQDSWVFDKLMLLATRVDTGNPNPLDGNPLMQPWKEKWLEKRGM